MKNTYIPMAIRKTRTMESMDTKLPAFSAPEKNRSGLNTLTTIPEICPLVCSSIIPFLVITYPVPIMRISASI